MQVDDHVLHFRIVDCTLCIGAPSLFSRRIVFEDAYEIEATEIGKVKGLRILDPAAHYEVKLLHRKNLGSCAVELCT